MNTNKAFRAAARAPFGKRVPLGVWAGVYALAQTVSSGARAAEDIPWPSEGVFPAYPEEPERGVHPYLVGTGVIDDNLFRQSHIVTDESPDTELGDRYARLGGGVEGDLEWGRQKLVFDAHGDHYSFDRNSDLDRWLYGGNADWQWHAGDNLSGTLAYSGSLAYPNFAELQSFSEDTVRSQNGQFGVNWRALSRMSITALLEGSKQDHSDETRSDLDNRITSGTLGLFYVSKEETHIGMQERVTDGEYPHRQQVDGALVDNQYRESETSFVVSKPFVTRVQADLRVGYTKRRHEEVPERDFDGATGRLDLRYAPLPKVLIYMSGYRELQPVDELSASYAVAEGGHIGPAWAPTSTIVFQIYYSYEERVLQGDPGFVLSDTPPRKDRTQSGRAALGYRPNDNFEIVLAYEHGERESNEIGADYQFNVGWLDVKVSL